MSYNSRCKTDALTPEEQEVSEVLTNEGYMYTHDSYQWVPIKLLYRLYRNERVTGKGRYPYEALTIRQFGAAFGRIFPATVRVVRRVEGKRLVGRANLTGPQALTTPKEEEIWAANSKRRRCKTNHQ